MKRFTMTNMVKLAGTMLAGTGLWAFVFESMIMSSIQWQYMAIAIIGIFAVVAAFAIESEVE